MKRTRGQIKAELMRKAEELIERLLDWQAGSQKPTLTQIENEVLAARRALSEEMVQALLKGEEVREPSAAPLCPGCGQVLANKGKQPKVVESRVGRVLLERDYYYCAGCEAGFFPPG